MSQTPDRPAPDSANRQAWMAVLARAECQALEQAVAALDGHAEWSRLRAPETGMVMVRGRAGGDGAPFNLGEMTVTRCAVALPCGTVGHAYVAGRDHRKAELAAVLDAVLQTDAGEALRRGFVAEEAVRQQERRRDALRRAAATRVDFFSMVRMG